MARFKVEWSTEARLDLLDILEFYLERNGNLVYSSKINTKINRSIKLLIKNPFLGKKTEYDSVRALISGDYQIIYEIFDQMILIIMIWDCRRDPSDKIIDQRKK
jgi:plasmid stabilization system protein ParE